MKSVARSSERTEEIRFMLMRAPFEKRVQLAIELGGGVLGKAREGSYRTRSALSRASCAACCIRAITDRSERTSLPGADATTPSRRSIESRSPSHASMRRTGPAATSSHPCFNAMRHPAKLPLSTVDTYRGRSGCRFFVSYQLRRCPW
jgi:hypothetical protein